VKTGVAALVWPFLGLVAAATALRWWHVTEDLLHVHAAAGERWPAALRTINAPAHQAVLTFAVQLISLTFTIDIAASSP
jgi:hypothetical protein